MELTPYVTTVEDSLVAAAAAGDDATRRTATALAAALEPATRLAIMDALSDLAMEVTDALGDRTVDLRLEPGQVRRSRLAGRSRSKTSSPTPRWLSTTPTASSAGSRCAYPRA